MKKVWKRILPFCLALSLLSAVGCKKTPAAESVPAKPITGIDPVFVEQLGYNNQSPCAVEIDGARYLYYTRNSSSMGGADEIVIRKGTLSDGAWTYGDHTTVLSPAQSGWDGRHVFAPTVVQGKFGYNGTDYGYLMAYAGTNVSQRQNAQIGLAVSDAPDGGWVRVGEPVVTYDKLDFSSEGQFNAIGATEPSLVSFDKQGKVYLFYSLFAPSISATLRFVELDLSSIANVSVKATYGSVVAASGAEDATADSSLLNADVAFAATDGEYARLYAVKDKYPVETKRPTVSASVGLYRGGEYEALYRVLNDKPAAEVAAPVWTQMGEINFRRTAVLTDPDRMDGYARIFSAAIVTNGYGWLENESAAEIVFTASPTADYENYQWARSLHSLTIALY